MAQRGPKPKPIEQAKRDGTHPSRIPGPPLRTGFEAKLDLPEYFNKFQEAAWYELVEVLEALDTLDTADALMVETAAAMVGRMREARHELQSCDMIEVTQRGASVPSPWWKIEREAGLQVARLLAELGIGPSARARLSGQNATSKKPEDALEAMLGTSARHDILQGKKKANEVLN